MRLFASRQNLDFKRGRSYYAPTKGEMIARRFNQMEELKLCELLFR